MRSFFFSSFACCDDEICGYEHRVVVRVNIRDSTSSSLTSYIWVLPWPSPCSVWSRTAFFFDGEQSGISPPLRVVPGKNSNLPKTLAAPVDVIRDVGIRTRDEKRNKLTDIVRPHTYEEGTIFDAGGMRVSALRVDHPPVTDCFALRFETAGTSVVFSADTCYFPPLADFAKDAGTLVHEAMLGPGIDALVARMKAAPDLRAHLMASHTMAEDVGRIASSAEVRQLVLNHLIPADDPRFGNDDWKEAISATWSGPVIVGRDGLEIGLSGE